MDRRCWTTGKRPKNGAQAGDLVRLGTARNYPQVAFVVTVVILLVSYEQALWINSSRRILGSRSRIGKMS